MTPRLNMRAALAAALVVIALTGCASPADKPLYQWEGYATHVYQHLRAPGADSARQIADLELGLQKIKASSGAVPPGYQAHLGFLYLSAGDEARGLAYLQAEADAFAEFRPYMTFLLARGSSK